MRFQAFLTTLKRDKRLTGGALALDAPFNGTGQAEGGHVVATQQSRSKDKGVTEASSYWTAHRIGGR